MNIACLLLVCLYNVVVTGHWGTSVNVCASHWYPTLNHLNILKHT